MNREKTGLVIKQFAGRQIVYLLLLAAGVRLINIQARGLQYDDVFSIFLSRRGLNEIISGTAADTMPPLYYFLLHFWMLVSREIWFIRGLSVFLSVLAVLLLYELVKRLAGPSAAAWAGVLMAISPFQYYHAQDVRNYALLLCAQLGYLLFFVRIWQATDSGRKTHWGNWAGLIGCGTTALYTHNVAIFGLVIPDAYLLVTRRWRLLGKLLLAQAATAVLALPWLLLVPGQIAKVQRAWWQDRPGLLELVQIPVVWAAGLPLSGIWLGVGFFVSLEVMILSGYEVIRRGRQTGVLFLGFVIVLLPALMFGVSYILRPIFVPRGFILAAAAYCGLCGWVIAAGWKRGVGKLVLAGFVAAAVIGIPAQATFQGFPRSPFQAATAEIALDQTPGIRVVHDNKLSYFPFHFYQPNLTQTFIADPPGSGNDTYARASQKAMDLFPSADVDSAVGNSRYVYFVVFTRAIQEYRALYSSDYPVLVWLRERYRETGHRVYNDLEVFRFERP
jgi:mannosyltransferase